MPNRDRWFLLVGCLLLAILVRWPTSVFWDALPRDPNTPLHALAALDLSNGTASPFSLSLLGYPDGLGVRLLAWPVLLCSLPFEFLLDPVEAFNLGVVLWLTLQGLVVGLLGARLGWNLRARLLAAAAIMTAPTTLRALGNGQFENVVVLSFVMGCLALLSVRKSHAFAWGVGAGLIAAFSSPYQGVVSGALVAIGVVLHRPKETWPALIGTILALLLAVIYFLGVTGGGVHLSALPAPGAMAEAASLGEIFNPFFYTPPFTTGELPSAGLDGARESLLAVAQTPGTIEFGTGWPWVNSVAYGYVGIVLLVSGAFGLWRYRNEPLVRVLGIFAMCCIFLALGSRLSWVPGMNTGIPMLWAIPSSLDSVGQMQATVRFLTGLSFACAVGLGFLCRNTNIRAVLGLGFLLTADGLFLAPTHWPVPAAAADVSAIEDVMEDGPVAGWPGPPTLAPRHHQTLALLLERPVAWFSGLTPEEGDLVESDGRRIRELELNEQGETPAEWTERVQRSGVRTVVQFQTPEGTNLGALFQARSAPICGLELCSWSLSRAPDPPDDQTTPAEPGE